MMQGFRWSTLGTSLLLVAAGQLAIEAAGAEPTPKTQKSQAGWKSLFDGKTLAGWKSSEFGGDGELGVEKGAIRLEMGAPFTGITYAGKFPKVNYEIELQARRMAGGDFFCALTFPVKKSFCSLVVGGWGGGLVGLSSLDGFDASENETTQWQNFVDKQWYKIRVRVTEDKILAWIDDKSVVDVETTDREIGIRFEVEPSCPLGIACWHTTAELRNLRFRPLESEAAKKKAD